uniref:Protein transport protein Sec31A n=1 Tax=Callorhinchus milii TaxID=7868 RepID=A0A4W3HSY6_CALMI
MKLKEINRTAIQAWSPAKQHPIYLAAGTSAQQLDATFSTNASLEIFELDLADSTLDMKSCGTFSSAHRYHKLIWGGHGNEDDGLTSGVLVAGGENGNIILYNPSKIIAGEEDVVIGQIDKHTGPVRALDFNPFQSNLVASGANESEIYIWDLNNFKTPMTPGSKSQPPEDISCVAWNRQVQHILASANPSGRAVVWDLRKNEPILKVSDHSNRMHCSGLAWHPDVATQMAVASEDDRMPVIQMWDLRFATSPLRVLENHTRGILAIAWSLADSELLLSCGKDNRILCWNPNTGEVVYELPTATQWCFDIQWCPRNPAVLSAAAFDGRISIYSLMGGNVDEQRQRQADSISSSFGNLDPFGTGQALPPLQLPQTTAQPSAVLPLKKPPKWVRRPVGATFAFGGKLVTFENMKPQHQQQAGPFQVLVSQVVTETELLSRSNQLQSTVHSGDFVAFCQLKVDNAQTDFERNMWGFLKVNFEKDSRHKYLELLGYQPEELAEKVQALLTGNFEGAVDLCLHDNRMADAIILAIAGGQDLLAKTQKKYFAKSNSKITRLIDAVVTRDWPEIVQSCDLQNWKEALAALLTYARPDEFAALCDLLGSRLESEDDSSLQAQACLCYICAGNVEKLVACWDKAQGGSSPLALQDLIEKVVVLRKAIELRQGTNNNGVGDVLAEKMSQYANLLAAQGSLLAALSYLPIDTSQVKAKKLAPHPLSVHITIPALPCSPTLCLSYQPQQYPQGAGRPTLYQPHQPIAPPPPSSYPSSYLPSAPSHSTAPPYPAPSQASPPIPGPASPFPPSLSGASYQHGGPGAPASSSGYALPTGPTGTSLWPAGWSLARGPQNGWNDPPALSRMPKKKIVPGNYTPPAPITAPIMNPMADPQVQMQQQLPQASAHLPLQASFQQHPSQQVHHNPYQAIPQTGIQPTLQTPKHSSEEAPGAPTGDIMQPVQPLTTEKIAKKPIPEEHAVLKTTFEGLIQRCMTAAGDPQTKRKLDDANKRLESLYDKLRDQVLSPTIIGGLHSIARSIETHNYAEGLNIHTHIVSTSNFSEISAFMPVLKVVLTLANKLGV